MIGYHPLTNSVFYVKAGVAQLAEHQPSKLRVAGSIPVSRSIMINGFTDLSSNNSAGLSLITDRFLFVFGPRSSVGGALPW